MLLNYTRIRLHVTLKNDSGTLELHYTQACEDAAMTMMVPCPKAGSLAFTPPGDDMSDVARCQTANNCMNKYYVDIYILYKRIGA